MPPQIAAKVAAPLSRVDEILILSGESNSAVSEANRLLAEIPASVRAITGVDLTKVSRAAATGDSCGSWHTRTFQRMGSRSCRRAHAAPSSGPNSFPLPLLQIPLIQKLTGTQE